MFSIPCNNSAEKDGNSKIYRNIHENIPVFFLKGKVNEFNENLITQIALRFDENVDSKTYRKIIRSYLNDDDLSNVCNRAEQNAFDEVRNCSFH